MAEGLERGSHPYFGTAQIRPLEKQLERPGASLRLRSQQSVELAYHFLRLGRVDEALKVLQNVFAEYRRLRQRPPESFLKALAMAFLREAEVANCVAQHGPDCCVFPLENGGVHREKRPAKQAHQLLGEILKENPDDLLVQWLLNLSAMALGDFPQSVPPAYRIPEKVWRKPEAPVFGRFIDKAPALGLDAFNLCGGVAVADFNGDGRLDIITSTYDPRGGLIYYHRRDDGSWADRGAQADLDVQLGGLNLLSADYDNDGDPDLLVLRGAWLGQSGRIRNSLLRNDGPSRPGEPARFTDVTRMSGLAEVSYPTQTAVWGDFDADGDLDLYVGNESLKDQGFQDSDFPSQLFINDGRGRFEDRAVEAGVTNDRFCKGVAAGDYDRDGDLDLYVSNVGRNRLYRNDGELKFTDVAAALGVSEPSGRSFAAWFFDYDNDGWLDLFVTGYEATPADLLADYRGQPHDATLPRLYRNTGEDGGFEDVTSEAGLDHVYLPMGANFGDLDSDGWLDIYLATGDPLYETLMPNVLLRNVGGKRFEDRTVEAGLGHLQKGHGVAILDFDGDGDQDLYHQLGGFFPGDKFHNALFLNPGTENEALTIKLVGKTSNRDGIGAAITVVVRTAEGRREIHRHVGIVSSFGGSPLWEEIGLGRAIAIEEVKVRWPGSGIQQRSKGISLGARIEITEGVESFQAVE